MSTWDRPLLHRLLLAAEMLLVALPLTLLCLLFGVGVVVSNAFAWWAQLIVVHFVLLGMVGMAGLWRAAVAHVWPRYKEQPPVYDMWWWRAACLGAGVVGVSLLLCLPIILSWNAPPLVVVIATGVFAMPLLVPFFHIAYLRRAW